MTREEQEDPGASGAHRRRRWVVAGLLLTIPLLLPTCCTLLVLVNSVNPMQLAFLTEFRVENRTDQTLWITPVGTVLSGQKHALPRYAAKFPAFPAFETGETRVEPGQAARICYDWDDINFTEIAVRGADGAWRQLVVDPSPPKDGYYANRQDAYAIESLASLPAASGEVLRAAQGTGTNRIWILASAGLIGPALFLTFVLLLLCGRRRAEGGPTR